MLPAGCHHRSITLEADAHHILTDVWTSAGVLIAIGVVAVTGREIIDPIIALLVAVNIVWAGLKLLQRSVRGLTDTAIDAEHRQAVQRILTQYEAEGIHYHALRTRQSGGRNFVEFHVLVPGWWSVKQGHTMLEHLERDIRKAVRRSRCLRTWSRTTTPLRGRMSSLTARLSMSRRPVHEPPRTQRSPR